MKVIFKVCSIAVAGLLCFGPVKEAKASVKFACPEWTCITDCGLDAELYCAQEAGCVPYFCHPCVGCAPPNWDVATSCAEA